MSKISPGLLLGLGLGGAMVLVAAGLQLFTPRAAVVADQPVAPAPVNAEPLQPTEATGLTADGLRPRVHIAVVDTAPPMRIQPGARMDVLDRVENGFRGLVHRSRRTLALNRAAPPPPVTGSSEYAGAEIDGLVYADARPEPQPVEGPPPARVRTYDGASVDDDDCRAYASRADRLICREPRLAENDRRLRAALDDAASGPDRVRVLSDQARWLAARERAAQDGPAAVDHMYAIRLRELEGG